MKALVMILASAMLMTATAHAGQMQIDCAASGVVINSTLDVNGKEVSGTVHADGTNIEDFEASANGSYTYFKAGSYYKDHALEIIEFWAISGNRSVAFKSYNEEDGTVVQKVFVNKKAVDASCVIAK